MTELAELGKGVPAFDVDSKHEFEIKAHAVIVGGIFIISYFCVKYEFLGES